MTDTTAALLIFALLALVGAVSVLGLAFASIQCIRECKRIWQFNKERNNP